MPLPLVPLIGAGAQLLSGGINAISQGSMNKKNRQFALEMYQRQRNDALADWNAQNAYNDPSAMMKRLKAAGLNPNLAYGNPTTAGTAPMPRQSSASVPEGKAPQWGTGISDAIMMFYEIQKTQAQTDNIKAQAELTRLKQEAVGPQIDKLIADTIGSNTATEGRSLLNQREKYLQGVGYYTDVAEQKASEQQLKRLELSLKTLLQDNTLEQAAAKLALMKSTDSAVRQRINNLIKEGKLLDFEIKLSDYGITRSDPGWIRAFIQLFTSL